MRIDKFINTVNIVKRRSIAADMIEHGVVYLNGVQAKASKDVKIGDKIEIRYLESVKKYEVLAVPTTKTIPKTATNDYIKELS
ncbi:MAG TPA: RNA-binding S4 domain-containing protein [Campylobacterales bacterium]|nr:RNA-binding S4 domain-containing protein [Campylobacterales bacterium]